MAKEAGYHNAKYAGVWEGRYVYEPVFSDEEIHFIGIPQFMVVEGGQLRWTKTDDESSSIMRECEKKHPKNIVYSIDTD